MINPFSDSLVHRSNSFEEDLSQVCDTSQPWALIIHGWTENCSTPWVLNLIPSWYHTIIYFTTTLLCCLSIILTELSRYRGGCIACMDYYALLNDNIHLLVFQFWYWNSLVFPLCYWKNWITSRAMASSLRADSCLASVLAHS